MRHLWFLRFLGLFAIRRPSYYQAIPFLVLWSWRGRRLGRDHLRSLDGRHWLLPSNAITIVSFPPSGQKILCGLWNAYRSCSIFWRCILGKVQLRQSEYSAHWWCIQRCWWPILARKILVARWEVGRNCSSLRTRPLGTLFLRPQRFRT